MATYAVHYSPRAPYALQYDARISAPYLRPLCRIRGRKDVTPVKDDVTCGSCRSRMSA